MPKVRPQTTWNSLQEDPPASPLTRRPRRGEESPRAAKEGLPQGEVVQVLGVQWEVKLGRQVIRCVLKRARDDERLPVVGDQVVLELKGGDVGRIVQILPRRTVLRRADAHRGQRDQVLAANVDQLLVVAAVAHPAPKAGLIDRYLVAAWRDGIHPVVCFNKIDLGLEPECVALMATFEGVGIPVFRSSATMGEGLEALRANLAGKRTVLAGLSGVGKTSLTRALVGDESLRVGALSEATGRGKHVTTSARCLELPGESGGALIDLPGHRVFALTGVQPEDLLLGFPEFLEAPSCLLPFCSHEDEEGCSLRALVEIGQVSLRRLQGYLRIRQELLSSADEEAQLED